MANEIKYLHDDGAETVYAIIRDMAGLWYVATTGEAFTLANWATYDIAMTEVDAIGAGVSGALQGTFPAVAAGYYWVDFYIQAAGAPASTDAHLSSILFYWDETTLIPAEAATNVVSVAGTTQTAGDIVGLIGALGGEHGTILVDTAEILTRLPDATAGATGGVAIVGSLMGLTDAAITAAKIDADAVTKIQDGLATATSLAAVNALVVTADAVIDANGVILAKLDTMIETI